MPQKIQGDMIKILPKIASEFLRELFMAQKKYFFATSYIVLLLAFAGCSSALKISARADASQSYALSVDIGKTLSQTIQSAAEGLSAMSGAAQTSGSTVLFETEKIRHALEQSGFKNAQVSSPEFSQLSVSASGTIERLVEQGKNYLAVNLSPQTVGALLSYVPEETRSYIDLFMAPVFTGEQMTAEEYAELVSVIYGESLAEELKKSAVQLTLASPAGKTKSFSIPLADFLTLSQKQTYTVNW